MELNEQIFENKWVKLEAVTPSPQLREFVKASGAVEAMWEWLPRLPDCGTTYDAYYDYVMAQVKNGEMLPVFAHSKQDGSFAGGANFMRINRTHRSVQIDYLWVPPHLRGSPTALAIQAALIKGAIDWRAKRLYWMVDTANKRQTAFIEGKLGLIKEGVLRSAARVNDGRWADIATYALVGDELTDALTRIEQQLETEFAAAD